MKAIRPFLGLRRMKRHGLIQVVAGFIYAMVGVSYTLAKLRTIENHPLEIMLRIAPLQFWGGVFIFAGVLSMISSVWPPHIEAWGYMVLTGLSFGWGSAYLMGILFAGSPWSNINGFFVWGLMGFMLWAISGLMNPEQTVVTNAPDRPL